MKKIIVVIIILLTCKCYSQSNTTNYGLLYYPQSTNIPISNFSLNFLSLDTVLNNIRNDLDNIIVGGIDTSLFLHDEDSTRFALRWNNWDKSNLDTSRFLYRYDSTKFALRYNVWNTTNLDSSRFLYRYDSTKFALRYNSWNSTNLDSSRFLYRYDSTKFALRWNNISTSDTNRFLHKADSSTYLTPSDADDMWGEVAMSDDTIRVSSGEHRLYFR